MPEPAPAQPARARGECHATPEPLPSGPVRACYRGGHGLRPAGDRPHPSRAQRALLAQRAQPHGPRDPHYHWFIGTGMVHGVRLRDGHAEWYRNRWVRSKAVAESLRREWPGGAVHAGMDFAADTHIIAHGGRTLATVEAGPLPYELSEGWALATYDFGGHCPAASPPTPSPTRGWRAARDRLFLGLGMSSASLSTRPGR